MKILITIVFAAFLSACSQVNVDEYANNSITFDPNVFFNNTLIAEGFVKDRSGKMTRYFTATIEATWDEQGGVLDEVFLWNDGERQTRVWTFEPSDNGGYIGTAGDVIGTADMRFSGNAINMKYVLDVPLESGKAMAINMDDWLYQVSESTIVNVTEMTKWGFHVGEVVLTMRIENE